MCRGWGEGVVNGHKRHERHEIGFYFWGVTDGVKAGGASSGAWSGGGGLEVGFGVGLFSFSFCFCSSSHSSQ